MDSTPKQTEANGLTRKQREAIPHLIGARSLEEGCRRAKLAKTTLFKWLKEEAFREALERTREEVISEALGRLKASITQAVDGLIQLMVAEEKSIRLRACQTVLDFVLRAREIEEVSERLTRVERVVFERRTYERR